MDKATRKKKLGGYPAIGVVISITLALLVIGMIGLLVSYSKQIEYYVRDNVAFKIYLKSSLSETQRKQVEQNLITKDFIAKTDKPITFVSKEEAAEELVHLEVMGENPFKDMYEVKIDPAYHDSLSLNKIKVELEKLSGVIDAEYEQDFLNDINENFAKISIVLLVTTAILLLAVIFLINNTLRIALFSQRFLIRSMQLVGAKKYFIQRPFLMRAIAYGVLAGIIASAILTGLTQYAYKKMEALLVLYNQEHFIVIMGSLIVLGAFIAVVSTYLSINKYLRMSLDELY